MRSAGRDGQYRELEGLAALCQRVEQHAEREELPRAQVVVRDVVPISLVAHHDEGGAGWLGRGADLDLGSEQPDRAASLLGTGRIGYVDRAGEVAQNLDQRARAEGDLLWILGRAQPEDKLELVLLGIEPEQLAHSCHLRLQPGL